jgi:hypothetical protein
MIPRLFLLFILIASPWTVNAEPAKTPRAQIWLQEAKDLTDAKVIAADESVTVAEISYKDHVVYGTLDRSLILIGADLYIVGRATGPILVIGGNVTVLGEAHNNVTVIGGSIRVAGTIYGKTLQLGGKLIVDEQGVVQEKNVEKGRTWYFKFSNQGEACEEEDENSGQLSTDSSTGASWFSSAKLWMVLVLMVCWAATSNLMVVFAPRALDQAARLFTRSPGRVWMVGIAFWTVFAPASILALILCFLIIGIPLLGGLTLIFFAVRWFGLAALILWLGRRLWLALRGREPSLPAALMIGLLALGLLHLVPMIGLILWLVLMIPVAGVAVLWLIESRSSQPPAPAPTVRTESPAAPPTEI